MSKFTYPVSEKNTQRLSVFLHGEWPGLSSDTTAAMVLAFRVAKAGGNAIALPDIPHVFSFTWVCKNKRRRPTNIASAAEFIFDALRQVDIIQNDGWGQVADIHHYFEVGTPVGVRVMAYRR